MANTNKTQKLEKTLNTIVIDPKDIKHTYSTMQGVVIGKMWGGGMGSYSARDYKADTLKELKEKLQKAFDLGSLDSGAGFEKLLAAGVIIVDEASVEIEGKVFKSSTYTNYVMGDEDLFQDKIDEGVIGDDCPVED